MTTASVISMPKSGFGKGRKSLYGSPLRGRSVSLTDSQWEGVDEEVEVISAQEERGASGSEVVRKAVEFYFQAKKSAPKLIHGVEMIGVVSGGDELKVQKTPRAPALEIPLSVNKDCKA